MVVQIKNAGTALLLLFFTTVPEPNTVLGRVFSEDLEPSRRKRAGRLGW